jgi:uncharacterized SAM-binding protein YcdF (DUF218 family)
VTRVSHFKRLILYGLATVGALLLLITLTPVVPLYVQATEPDWYDGNGEVLVILGGSMLVSGPGPRGTLGYDTYLRCIYASWVLRTQKFHYVVVTGGDGLADAMARFLEQNGVDSHAILTERSAQSTYENALFTRRILQVQYAARPLPEVVVLTSDYHAWRARLTFQHCGFRVRTIPIPDLIKRSGLRSFRLNGAEDIFSEWIKDIYYIVSGEA